MEDNKTEPTVDNEPPAPSGDSVPQIPQQHHFGHAGDESFFKSRAGHIVLSLFGLILVGGGAVVAFMATSGNDTETPQINFDSFTGAETPAVEEPVEPVETLDYTTLPLGDEKYTDEGPKKGFVFSCSSTYNGGGAFEQGPWIDADAGTWDLTQKISVDGSVSWPNAAWKANTKTSTRVLTSTDLPVSHNTGTFPVSTNDEAYQYDRNPNEITKQDLTLTLPLNPVVAASPECIGGEVGIATTGVLIFNALDAGGNDAVATEIQDECQGHPQAGGYYHYHGYSSCFNDSADSDEHSDLLGYAYDGFGIYGIRGENGIELSSNDLDACHGHSHSVLWDDQQTDIYHYHFTQDFPYTVSCFMGKPAVKALSSGEGAGGMMGNQIPGEGGGQQGPIEDLPPPPGSQ